MYPASELKRMVGLAEEVLLDKKTNPVKTIEGLWRVTSLVDEMMGFLFSNPYGEPFDDWYFEAQKVVEDKTWWWNVPQTVGRGVLVKDISKYIKEVEKSMKLDDPPVPGLEKVLDEIAQKHSFKKAPDIISIADLFVNLFFVTTIDNEVTELIDYAYVRGFVDDDERERLIRQTYSTGEDDEEETTSTKKSPPKEKPTHIMMDEERAKQLFGAVSDKEVDWLVVPLDEAAFVNRLTSKPTGEKIIFRKLNQIRYIAKNYLFPPQDGKKTRKVTASEWDLVRQLFDAEDGDMKNVNKACKKPEKHEIVDKMMQNRRRR